MGGVMLDFGEVPRTTRDEVVLPEAVLGRVERHALGYRRPSRRAARRRPAPEAGSAPVRTAGDRQDPHDPLSGRTDGRVHPASCSPDGRYTRSGRWPSSRGTSSPRSSSSRTSTSWRSIAASGRRDGFQPGPVRPARRDGRRRPRRRPAVRAHHQPRRPARAGAGGSSRPRRRRDRDRPAGRGGPTPAARAVRTVDPVAALGGREARDRRAHGRSHRLVRQGAAPPLDARGAPGQPVRSARHRRAHRPRARRPARRRSAADAQPARRRDRPRDARRAAAAPVRCRPSP